jgi:hypothetical protein
MPDSPAAYAVSVVGLYWWFRYTLPSRADIGAVQRVLVAQNKTA